MKKITLFLFILSSTIASSQVKTTGQLTFVTGLSGELTLDNGTAIATLTLKGPRNRWIAFKLGSFTTAMSASPDGVYYNGTTVVDGNGGQLTTDATQNWTLVSNVVTGSTRKQALERARRALAEFQIEGIATALPFHRAVINDEAFINEPFAVYTGWIESEFNNQELSLGDLWVNRSVLGHE